jgi:formate dehydrogenase maturation protein FdhE
MSKQAAQEAVLTRKIRRLPPDKLAEVEDFVDFLEQREDRRLTQAASKLFEKSFSKVWDNPDDAAYDQL